MKRLLAYTEQLKHLPRTGWLRAGISHPETVAAHSWQMAMMALYLSDKVKGQYDFDKLIKLCLCHDLAESVLGDITPKDKGYTRKSSKEKEIMDNISKETQFETAAQLFAEYEENLTSEAQLAHDLDKLDMYVQAQDYEQKYPDKDFEEFKASAVSQIKTPLGKALLKEIAK